MAGRGIEGGLIASVSRFGPRITVQVDREAFIFTSRKGTVQVRTFLYLKESAGRVTVLAVGDDVPVTPGVFRIDLFGNGRPPSGFACSIGRMECLEALCRFGIQKVTQHPAILRPHVTVVGLANLDSILHGYQAAVLQRALESAGARMIVFATTDAV